MIAAAIINNISYMETVCNSSIMNYCNKDDVYSYYNGGLGVAVIAKIGT